MALLVICVDIDIDTTLVDPDEVAESLMTDMWGNDQEFCDIKCKFVNAQWGNEAEVKL